MAARTTAKTKTDTAAPESNPEPTKTRKPRVPKPVTDLSTANAAFQKAKKAADKASKDKDAAVAAASLANTKLAEAARVLKGYTAELDAAVAGVLPTEVQDAPELTPAEDADHVAAFGEPVGGYEDDHGDHSEYDNA